MNRCSSSFLQSPFRRRLSTHFLTIQALFAACFLAGCSPSYVLRAAYEQSKILIARRPIEQVILDPETSPDDRKKLAYVLQARAHAKDIGLQTGRSFTAYADVGKETLAWVVVGSRKDAFALYTWWFPIVGTVPYKGFFNRDSAQEQAEELHKQGYETSIRGTEAFSTLGWFNDPVLSTTLRNSVPRIVSTVIHESVHSTVWIRDSVPFNETLASFVGSQATVEFFRQLSGQCAPDEASCKELADFVRTAQHDHDFQLEMADAITTLHSALSKLYRDSTLSSEQKIARRSEEFRRSLATFRGKYPQLSILREVNNAEIIQYTIYLTELPLFERLYQKVGNSWEGFFAGIRGIQNALEQDPSKEPFEELRKLIYSQPTQTTPQEKP